MKCYIETKRIYDTASMTNEWVAQLVTEIDYLFGGPHAHSYRTPRMPSVSLAREAAEEVAGDMLLQVVPPEQITG